MVRVDRFQPATPAPHAFKRVELAPWSGSADEPENQAILKQAVERADKVVRAPVMNGWVAVANGDVYAASKAIREVTAKSPALAPVTVVADLLLLSQSDRAAKQEVQGLSRELDVLVSEQATGADKVNSGINLATRLRSGIQLGEVVVEASGNVARTLKRFDSLSAVVNPMFRFGTRLAASPLGRVASMAGKWVPYLNVAATLTSYRNLWRVAHDQEAGVGTKALAVGSALAGTGLAVASFAPPLAPLVLPFALAGLGCDLGLLWAESRDQQHTVRASRVGRSGRR